MPERRRNLQPSGRGGCQTQDTKEKRNIGQLWAEKSGGKGLFLMAEKRDAQGRDTRAQILALAGH
jgi:hypothetical protein